MYRSNERQLENLSFYSHICGLITMFLGLMVVFMNVINDDMRQIQAGIFIFISGYAFVKISAKISRIIQDEKNASRTDY